MPDLTVAWDRVRTFMDKNCGVSLSSDQAYLLDARLGPVAKEQKFGTLEEYVHAACAAPARSPLAQTMIDAMTTHETYFFRDGPFWKAFEEIILPKLAAIESRPVRIWSAACSHGQEIYTIAMLMAEVCPQLVSRTSVVATDVSEAAVTRGRAGIYTSLEVNRGISAMRLIKHFDKAEGGFQIKPSLRGMITWRAHNLLDPMLGESSFDVIMCRNVFIYFNDRDRKTAISHLVSAVRPEGYIALGTSEIFLPSPIAPGWFSCPKKV